MNRILITGTAGGLGKMLRQSLAGYAPVLRLSDVADLGEAAPREELEAEHPRGNPDDPAVIFQGGAFAVAGHFED